MGLHRMRLRHGLSAFVHLLSGFDLREKEKNERKGKRKGNGGGNTFQPEMNWLLRWTIKRSTRWHWITHRVYGLNSNTATKVITLLVTVDGSGEHRGVAELMRWKQRTRPMT